jgi:hypothetical protein
MAESKSWYVGLPNQLPELGWSYDNTGYTRNGALDHAKEAAKAGGPGTTVQVVKDGTNEVFTVTYRPADITPEILGLDADERVVRFFPVEYRVVDDTREWDEQGKQTGNVTSQEIKASDRDELSKRVVQAL